MKTSTVQAFKYIASCIHPQLPLTERESRRLLNALTTSFEKHLDQEHPLSSAPSISADAFHAAPTPVPQASSVTTDHHLASILTNPLLSKPYPSEAAISQLKSRQTHPISIFEEHVSRGNATLDVAKLCLQNFQATLEGLSSSDAQEKIQSKAAGLRVLRWLWSSGNMQSDSIVRDRKFLDSLLYFLVREKREDAIWDLIVQSQEPHDVAQGHTTGTKKARAFLFFSLVKTKFEMSPESGLAAFANARYHNRKTSVLDYKVPMGPAGAFLSKALVRMRTPRTLALEQSPQASIAFIELYDRFVESCPSWDKGAQDRALYRVANLKLHHPASPSPRDALYFIRHLKQSKNHPFLAPATRAQKQAVFDFFFDTVTLLQNQNSPDDAAWVLDFMQQAFPHELAEQQQTTKEAAAAAPSTVMSHGKETSEQPAKEADQLILPDWRVPILGS